MKFVKIVTHTDEFFKTRPENFGELLEKHRLWLEEKKREGKLLEAYVLAGHPDRHIIFIWDFESPEEIDKMLFEDPIDFTFNWPEVYPAVDLFGHIDNVMPTLTSDNS